MCGGWEWDFPLRNNSEAAEFPQRSSHSVLVCKSGLEQPLSTPVGVDRKARAITIKDTGLQNENPELPLRLSTHLITIDSEVR